MKAFRTTYLALTAGFATVASAAAASAHARDLCAADRPGRYRTLQAALAAAHTGDTVHLGRGTFRGGVRILTGIGLAGEGAHTTVIRGGGPVLTIGTFGAASEPTVSITGVSIAGGRTHSSAQSRKLVGNPQALAFGGGIEVPPGAGFSHGATVTISDSVITGNRVAPRATVPSGLPCRTRCPFALAGGGGIDNWGRMTLINVVVSDNQAGGPLTSDADAGGIFTPQGSLTLCHSVVTRNRAVASRPYGRFAEGGGVNVTSSPFFLAPRRRTATLTIDASRITANSVSLADRFPGDVEAHADQAGVLIAGDDDCTKPTSGCVRASIRNTSVSDNTATAANTAGDATAFGGGIGVDGSLVLTASAVDRNRVLATVPAGSTAGAFGDSAGIGMGGYASISNSQLVGNTVTARAPAGTASAMFARLSSGNPTLTTKLSQTLIRANRLKAVTNTGSIVLQGGGIGHLNGGPLVLWHTIIKANAARGVGSRGVAEGGGLWNGNLDPLSSVGPLRITDGSITQNTLITTAGIAAHGGGIFTVARPSVHRTTTTDNEPDECQGC